MEKKLGIVITPDCFLHQKPGSSPERNESGIEDEIFSGWAVFAYPQTEEHGWIEIETHYGYRGYVKCSELRMTEERELRARQDKERYLRVCVGEADLLDRPKVQGLPKELLLKGALVELLKREVEAGWSLVRTACGQEGYVHTAYLGERRDDDGYLFAENEGRAYFRESFLAHFPQEAEFREALVRSARAYLGTQYRWGGKSSQGLDCSGLVFMSYLENGVLIYRDAKLLPEYPLHEISTEELKPGDLIFFPGHVAMYLGEGKFIHSTAYAKTPCVTVNSLRPEDADYREDLAKGITGCASVFGKRAAVWEEVKADLEALPGNISAVCVDLESMTSYEYRADEPHIAASVIKLFLMAAVFQGIEDGRFSAEDRITVKKSDCVPSCGVLTYLQEEQSMTIRDLTELMVIVSDNTATNVLFDFVGGDYIETVIRTRLQMEQTSFARKMFDGESAAKGIENYVTAKEAARLLMGIYRGEVVSKEASTEMYQILTHQRLNGKIPFYLHTLKNAPVIAHKTGEDGGTTHDVAVIEGERPLVLCFLGNETDVPAYEKLMAKSALALYHSF